MAEQEQEEKTQRRGTPTEKMVQWARKVAERLGLELTEEQETDFDACRAFLDENSNNVPPTKKQIDLVRKLADERGLDLPEGMLKSQSETRDWLDEQLV